MPRVHPHGHPRHDDIIDDSSLRRGRLAVHSQWGNDITVLLGDYLYIKSMALALTHDELEIIRLLCDVTLRMIEGELYQLTKNGDPDVTEDEHFEIIRRKTAYLFSGCARIGAMLGRRPPREAWRIRVQPASPSSWSTTRGPIPDGAALGSPWPATCEGGHAAGDRPDGRAEGRSGRTPSATARPPDRGRSAVAGEHRTTTTCTPGGQLCRGEGAPQRVPAVRENGGPPPPGLCVLCATESCRVAEEPAWLPARAGRRPSPGFA
jgi:hypothetical protein